MKLKEEEIFENYNKLISYIDIFEGDRKQNLKKIYDDLGERIILAPASNKAHFHSCFPGGHVFHTLKVIEIGKKLIDVWGQFGEIDFTEEQFIMVAMNHDLGKIGDLENDYYVQSENEWRIKNLGEVYTRNPKMVNMEHSDRSLWLLQFYNIKLTQTEWLAIKLHGGLYTKGNESYLMSYEDAYRLRSSLPTILHFADLMAAEIEYFSWKKEGVQLIDKKSYKGTKASKIEKTLSKKTTIEGSALQSTFDELFNKE